MGLAVNGVSAKKGGQNPSFNAATRSSLHHNKILH